jgi:hypothetical protein
VDISVIEDYTSDNSTRLEGDALVEFLLAKLGQKFFKK